MADEAGGALAMEPTPLPALALEDALPDPLEGAGGELALGETGEGLLRLLMEDDGGKTARWDPAERSPRCQSCSPTSSWCTAGR